MWVASLSLSLLVSASFEKATTRERSRSRQEQSTRRLPVAAARHAARLRPIAVTAAALVGATAFSGAFVAGLRIPRLRWEFRKGFETGVEQRQTKTDGCLTHEVRGARDLENTPPESKSAPSRARERTALGEPVEFRG